MSQTISTCLKHGVDVLEFARVPEAQISAEELLSLVTGKPRFSLHLDSEIEIKPQYEERFEALLKKRATRFPLQYLLGEVSFRNVTLEVGEGCLIPRPETEILVEVALQKLGCPDKRGQVSDLSPFMQVLDIGTGSGNIAISLAQERPDWFVTGTDSSRDALYYARKNADRNHVAEKIQFIESDLFPGVAKQFDAIISNPPYLTQTELAHMQPELIFEPVIALDGGAGGLDFFKRIATGAKVALKKGGFIFFEVGMDQSKAVSAILKENGFEFVEASKDNAGIERIISGVLV